MSETTTSIYKKIAQVILHDNTKAIAKSPNGYSSDDVYAALRTAMAENNLVCIPSFVEKTNDGPNNWVKFLFTLVDADSGEQIESEWRQIIPQTNPRMTIDKCVGAASTYAHKYFLMRTFMLTSSDDPKIDDPNDDNTSNNAALSLDHKHPVIGKNGKTVRGQHYTEAERIARDIDMKLVYKIERDPNDRAKLAETQRHIAWCKPNPNSSQPMRIDLYPEHMAEIASCLKLTDEWQRGANGYYPTRTFEHKLGIYTCWSDKHNRARYEDTERTFKNPAIKIRFFQLTKGTPPEDIKAALGVNNSANYKGSLSDALKAVKDYTEDKADGEAQIQAQNAPETDVPPNVTPMNPYPKQTMLDKMPAVEQDA